MEYHGAFCFIHSLVLFTVKVDPEAAKIVFESGVPIVQVPIEVITLAESNVHFR